MKLTTLVLFASSSLAHTAMKPPNSPTDPVPHAFPAGCYGRYVPGSDLVVETIPYTFKQSMSIIGSYKNLTWAGTPANKVKLNGPDNTVGTTRTYEALNTQVYENITHFSWPPGGPYREENTVSLLDFGKYKVYVIADIVHVKAVCGGKASQFKIRTHLCTTNKKMGVAALHAAHAPLPGNVAKLLGGKKFKSCRALEQQD